MFILIFKPLFLTLRHRAKKGGSRSCATARKRKQKMKKMMFAAAVAAGLAAFGDGIESSNTVGYNTVTINKEYTILGIPFTGTTGAAMSIQDAVPYSAGMTKSNAASGADCIQIMDSTGSYDVYFMCNGKKAKATVTDGDGKWVSTTAKLRLD